MIKRQYGKHKEFLSVIGLGGIVWRWKIIEKIFSLPVKRVNETQKNQGWI